MLHIFPINHTACNHTLCIKCTKCLFFQVNLKASATKNELNAVIHFIKFLKRSRNMAVTDAAFNATLENIKDIVSTCQV